MDSKRNHSGLTVSTFQLCLPLIVAVFMLNGCNSLNSHSVSETIPLADDLGSHHYPVSTSEPAAQRYFDQGLILTFLV